MQVYRITANVSVEKKGTLAKKVIRLESETHLTVKQIKDQCFAKLKIDEEMYTKKSEEVWQSGVSLSEANPDTEIFDKRYQTNPDYYLVVTEK